MSAKQPPAHPPQTAGKVASGLLLLVGAVLGVSAGVGGYTFVYAKGGSYLLDSPAACANCHIMNEQYDGWTKSSHHAVATCNDCHTPHDFFGKYTTKAINGWNHSWAFTMGGFHEPIQMTPRNYRVTQGACRHCHADVVAEIDAHAGDAPEAQLDCIRCHRSVGHLH